MDSILVSDLQTGDRLVVRTSHSVYEFWVEFANLSVGVLHGGRLPSPARVQLAAESSHSWDASAEPIRIGDRARVTVLGPDGQPMRCFVTSRVVKLLLHPRSRIAA